MLFKVNDSLWIDLSDVSEISVFGSPEPSQYGLIRMRGRDKPIVLDERDFKSFVDRVKQIQAWVR